MPICGMDACVGQGTSAHGIAWGPGTGTAAGKGGNAPLPTHLLHSLGRVTNDLGVVELDAWWWVRGVLLWMGPLGRGDARRHAHACTRTLVVLCAVDGVALLGGDLDGTAAHELAHALEHGRRQRACLHSSRRRGM